MGDLGGTQVRLELYRGRQQLAQGHKLTRDSKTLSEDILQAMKEWGELIKGEQVEAAVFGIAGPVDEGRGVVPVLVDVP